MILDEKKTLGELLRDPRIAPIASDAITNMDLSKEDMWNKSLAQLREEHFGGNLTAGFQRLFTAAETGSWYYPLYSEEECTEDESRKGVSLVWFPSGDKSAQEKPFILLVPGGGFVNVWNLTEGWPVAAQYNQLGYNVFILTYRVTDDNGLLDREMEDFASRLEASDISHLTDQELYDSLCMTPETIIEWMKILYGHREAVTLLVRCSGGTRFENFHHDWAERREARDRGQGTDS